MFFLINTQKNLQFNIFFNWTPCTFCKMIVWTCFYRNKTWLSTSPLNPLTHWYQVRCLLQTPALVFAGQVINGRLVMSANERLLIHYDLIFFILIYILLRNKFVQFFCFVLVYKLKYNLPFCSFFVF